MARTADGRWQPMPAIYRRSAIGAIDETLERGNRSVTSIFGIASVEEISESELRALDPELDCLFSLNRPEQLDRARQCVSCR